MRKFLAVSRKGRVNGKRTDIYTLYELRDGRYVLRCYNTFIGLDSLIVYLRGIIGDCEVGFHSSNGVTFAEAGYYDITEGKALAELEYIEAL